MKNKANWFKGIATVGGISTGALLGTASTAALVGGPAGWLLGGAVGNYIGDQIIKNDTSGDFIDQNGNFRDGKATTFKTFTTITGAGAGAAVGSGVALALGLVSNPVGWTVLACGAVLGIACGLVSWAIKKWA